MSEHIHRNGDRYRVWYTIPDAYDSGPLTRAEMAALLVARGQHPADVEERLARADRNGTSAYNDTRDATAWDTERCARCGNFHHAFAPREADGLCAACGEGERDRAHRPPCGGGQ